MKIAASIQKQTDTGRSQMARFAVLVHDYPTLHWDFLLEAGSACRTWRLAQLPAMGTQVSAVQIADHRLIYLDYEGPVGGNRGSVTCWDRGIFQWITDDLGRVEIELRGSKLDSTCTLTSTGDNQWIATFSKSR